MNLVGVNLIALLMVGLSVDQLLLSIVWLFRNVFTIFVYFDITNLIQLTPNNTGNRRVI